MGRCTGLCLTRFETEFFEVLAGFSIFTIASVLRNRVCTIRFNFLIRLRFVPFRNVYLVCLFFFFLIYRNEKSHTQNNNNNDENSGKIKTARSSQCLLYQYQLVLFTYLCAYGFVSLKPSLPTLLFFQFSDVCMQFSVLSALPLIVWIFAFGSSPHKCPSLSFYIYKRTIYIMEIVFVFAMFALPPSAFLFLFSLAFWHSVCVCVCGNNIDVSVCGCVSSFFPVHRNVSLSHSRCLSVVSPDRVRMLLLIPCCCGCSMMLLSLRSLYVRSLIWHQFHYQKVSYFKLKCIQLIIMWYVLVESA